MPPWIFGCLLIGLSGCAATNSVQRAEVNEYPKAQGSDTLVYFIRPRLFQGSGLNADILEIFAPNEDGHDSERVGTLSNSTYFFVRANPGPHQYTYSNSWTTGKPGVHVVLSKGETAYFALGSVGKGSYLQPMPHGGVVSVAHDHIGLVRITPEAAAKLLPEVNMVARPRPK